MIVPQDALHEIATWGVPVIVGWALGIAVAWAAARLARPFPSDWLAVNNESNFSANCSFPPINAIKPGTSCGTNQEYCELVASVTSWRFVPPPNRWASKLARQLPLASLERIQPRDGS